MKLIEYIKSASLSILCQLTLVFMINLVLISSTSLDKSIDDIIYLDVLLLLTISVYFVYDFLRQKSRFGKVLKALAENKSTDYQLPYDQSFYSRLLRAVTAGKEKENLALVASYKNKMDELNDYIIKWVHEIKIPISVLELMLENTDAMGNDSSRKFKAEIARIRFLANQVLYAGRASHYQEDLNISEFPLQKVVREALRTNSHFFISKNIEIAATSLDYNVLSDEKWIIYILEQILNNASKYVGEGGKVAIFAREDEKAVHLHIRDNGIGIPPSDISRIFDKGFTGENGRKTSKSTGMGLYYAKIIAGRLSLDLEVSSKVGEYTEFVITFYKLSEYFNISSQ